MSRQITITITVPDGVMVRVSTKEVSDGWDIWEWGREWEVDCKKWFVDNSLVVGTHIYYALLRAGSIKSKDYDFEKEQTIDCEPYSYAMQSTEKPYPDFYDALPMIASGAIVVRNIGEKSRQVIANVFRIGEVVSVYSGVRYGRYVVKRDYDLPGARLIRLIEEQDCEVVYEIVGA